MKPTSPIEGDVVYMRAVDGASLRAVVVMYSDFGTILLKFDQQQYNSAAIGCRELYLRAFWFALIKVEPKSKKKKK